MKIAVVSVGKAKGAVGEAIGEYEARARRYFAFEPHEVREEQYRGRSLCDENVARGASARAVSCASVLLRVRSDHRRCAVARILRNSVCSA